MERDSIPIGSLLFLGIILLIFGGSSMGSVPTSYWLEQFKLFLFIGGCVLIIAAVVLMIIYYLLRWSTLYNGHNGSQKVPTYNYLI